MNDVTKPLSRWFVLLLAISTGVAVASNYYAQPLLNTIASDLDVSIDNIGLIVTVSQLSYACGLLFLVPLGDILERRRLIISMSCCSIIGLLISGFAHNIYLLMLGTAISGLFAVMAQVLIPFAATLASPLERGKVVGTVMSGLLLGILLARTASGFSSTLGNWRTIYFIAAVVLSIITFLLYRSLPHYPANSKMHYAKLISSTIKQFSDHPKLICYGLLALLNFTSFGLLWTPLALLLSGSPFNYNDAIIGLFGLVGAAGVLVAPYAGKLADQGKGLKTITFGIFLLFISWIPLNFAKMHVVFLIIGILVLDFAIHAIHITSMNQVYQLNPEARNRLNACYMTCYFIGGALGSLVSTYIYAHYGWSYIAISGMGVALFALLLWFALYPKERPKA